MFSSNRVQAGNSEYNRDTSWSIVIFHDLVKVIEQRPGCHDKLGRSNILRPYNSVPEKRRTVPLEPLRCIPTDLRSHAISKSRFSGSSDCTWLPRFGNGGFRFCHKTEDAVEREKIEFRVEFVGKCIQFEASNTYGEGGGTIIFRAGSDSIPGDHRNFLAMIS